MKDGEVANMMACLADAETRSTAMLIEVVAAAALVKLNPPEGDAVVELEITQGDMAQVGQEFLWLASYDEHGTMKLQLSRKVESLISAQSEDDVEVTSADE
jgi:hypothetical protein